MNNVDGPLIRINADSAEKIAELYDVGPGLAARIVTYRETHGYFARPEDLAEVEGMSLNLATTLGPHIDWQTPTKQELPGQGRDWSMAVVIVTGLAVLIWVIVNRSFPDLRNSLFEHWSGNPQAWLDIWLNISILFTQICGCLGVFAILIRALSCNLARIQRWTRICFLFIGISGMVQNSRKLD